MKISDMANMGLHLGNRLNGAIKAAEKASERLASGKKINTAADSPSDMLRISRFGSQIRGSRVAQQNIQQGVSLMQTMDQGLAAIEEMGQQLRELAVAYHSDGISDESRAAIKAMGETLRTEIEHRLENTVFGGTKVFKKETWSFQTGPYSGDNITINISVFAPTINGFGTGIAPTPPIGGTGCQPPTAPPTSPAPIPQFSLTSPVAQLPEQCGFSGYRKVLDGNGQTIYEGNLKNGKPDGYGKLYTNGKTVYEGDWTNGTIDGFGRLFDAQGREKYTGVTEMGTPHGFGSYFENGQILHQGEFINGYRQGWGTTYTSSGPVSMHYNDYTISLQGVSSNQSQTTPPTATSTPATGSAAAGSPVWLSLDRIDKQLLEPIANFRSYVGSMQSVLEHRLSFQQRSEEIGTAALSKVQDADMAKEALELARQQLLGSTSLQLIQQVRDQNREFILRLLS